MPDRPVTHREFWRALRYLEIVLSVLTVILLTLGGWSVYLQFQHGEEVAAIQLQRATTIREACEAQNARNLTLTRFLESLPQQRHVSARKAVLLRQFVDALAPHEDCAALVRRRASRL